MRLLILTFFFAVASLAQAHEILQQDQISVVGEGEVEHEPDQAILNIGISAQKPTLLEAKQEADANYQAVLDEILAAGIEEKDIKATRIIAQPQYEWTSSRQVYKGERVSRSLSVTINDLDAVSSLMQSIVAKGVSTIDGMTTGFQNPEILEQEALGMAADDARSKAEFLAERLGRTLGDAYLITQQTNAPVFHQPNVQMMRSDAIAESSAVPPEMFGTQTIKATVSVSFNLL